MKNRKSIGILALFFASISIRIPVSLFEMHVSGQTTVFQDNITPFVVNTISLLLFAFGTIQIFVSLILEDLPALREFWMRGLMFDLIRSRRDRRKG